MAQYRAGGQAFCKPGDLVRVAFILRLIGRRFPMQKNIAAAGIAAAGVIGVCGFPFVHPVGGKSDYIITLQTGAKWIAIATLGATKFGQIFGRASDKPRAVTINSFAAVPKIKRNRNHNGNVYGAAFAADI
jgi:hypothetical protein